MGEEGRWDLSVIKREGGRESEVDGERERGREGSREREREGEKERLTATPGAPV